LEKEFDLDSQCYIGDTSAFKGAEILTIGGQFANRYAIVKNWLNY